MDTKNEPVFVFGEEIVVDLEIIAFFAAGVLHILDNKIAVELFVQIGHDNLDFLAQTLLFRIPKNIGELFIDFFDIPELVFEEPREHDRVIFDQIVEIDVIEVFVSVLFEDKSMELFLIFVSFFDVVQNIAQEFPIKFINRGHARIDLDQFVPIFLGIPDREIDIRAYLIQLIQTRFFLQ